MGNHQSSESITNIKNTVITDIQNTMKSNFTSTFKSTTKNTCSQTATNQIKTGDIDLDGGSKLTITNEMKLSLKCSLEQANEQDMQTNIISSLSAAIEKNLDAELLKKLDQKAESSLGSMGNTQSSTTKTDVENTSYTNINKLIDITVKTEVTIETILEAKQEAYNSIEVGKITMKGGSEFTLGNSLNAFLDSKIITKAVNSVINKIADDTIIEEHVKTNTKETVEVKQDTKSKGIGEVFESIGKMVGNIFSGAAMGAMGPLIIIIVVILVGILLYKLSSSSSQPQQYQQYPPYLPQQFPQQQFAPKNPYQP